MAVRVSWTVAQRKKHFFCTITDGMSVLIQQQHLIFHSIPQV